MEQTNKGLLPAFLSDTYRFLRNKNKRRALRRYLSGGKIPWSEGYTVYRRDFIAKALADGTLLEKFKFGKPLPSGYGIGIDERCVELPWLMSHLPDGGKVLLDAGSALNHDFILDHRFFERKVIHIVTLAPESRCFWQRKISYFFHDLRDIPIRDSYYDVVVCLSTLEHVGCNNIAFTRRITDRENRPEEFVLAMREFCRVLKPGGVLLLTVPFGVYRHFGTFQQFDKKLIEHAIEAFGEASEVIEKYYRYRDRGWNVADPRDCKECEYVEWRALPSDQRLFPPPAEPDLAAAARAVACVRLIK